MKPPKPTLGEAAVCFTITATAITAQITAITEGGSPLIITATPLILIALWAWLAWRNK